MKLVSFVSGILFLGCYWIVTWLAYNFMTHSTFDEGYLSYIKELNAVTVVTKFLLIVYIVVTSLLVFGLCHVSITIRVFTYCIPIVLVTPLQLYLMVSMKVPSLTWENYFLPPMKIMLLMYTGIGSSLPNTDSMTVLMGPSVFLFFSFTEALSYNISFPWIKHRDAIIIYLMIFQGLRGLIGVYRFYKNLHYEQLPLKWEYLLLENYLKNVLHYVGMGHVVESQHRVPKSKCFGKTSKGTDCQRSPLKGRQYCKDHCPTKTLTH